MVRSFKQRRQNVDVLCKSPRGYRSRVKDICSASKLARYQHSLVRSANLSPLTTVSVQQFTASACSPVGIFCLESQIASMARLGTRLKSRMLRVTSEEPVKRVVAAIMASPSLRP